MTGQSPTYSSQTELETIVSTALESGRPILHHLNADTTWLLQLPIPSAHTPTPTREWFNIILDPWLSGAQSDVASWFSRQWHAIEPAYTSIEEVEVLCRTVEELSGNARARPDLRDDERIIDLVAVSHEFTDHCHKDTLVQFPSSTPVVASTKAAKLIAGWKHFDTVVETPTFGGTPADAAAADWRELSVKAGHDGAVPSWMGVGRVVNTQDALYYHSAIMIVFQLDSDSDTADDDKETTPTAEAIIYTPHGIHADSLRSVVDAQPPIQTLGILHGLHDVRIDWGQQLNLGAVNGLKAQQMLDGRYWIGTHDEVKKGGGLVSWLLRRKVYTVDDVLGEAQKQAGGNNALGRGEYLDLENGRSLVLR